MENVVAFDRKPWTAGEDLTVRTMILAGLTDAQIGLALERSEASVRTHICRLGIRRRPRLSERIAIVRMARRGATVRRIAASRRQDETTVRLVLAEAEVQATEFNSYEGPNRRRAGRYRRRGSHDDDLHGRVPEVRHRAPARMAR